MALSAWDRVRISRGQNRPTSLFYIEQLFDDFTELHGDRHFSDDKAIVGRLLFSTGVLSQLLVSKRDVRLKKMYAEISGMPNPEGYRKALRLMQQADKFNRPIICFVDTAGAFCGMEAEERGQGEAITRMFLKWQDLGYRFFLY